MHIASLILGIIAIITCFIPFFGAAVSLIALIIAIAAMCVKRPNNEGKGMKIAGLVLSIIAFVISLIITVIPSVLLISNLDTDLIEDATNELGNISQALQNQLVQSFDGKTMSGADVLATCRQYQHSDTVSVKIIVDKDKEFNTGMYNTTISDDVKQTLTAVKTGGIKVNVTGENTNQASYTDVSSVVTPAQTYYSYIMKKSTTEDIIGIIFVKKDWNKTNSETTNEQSKSNTNVTVYECETSNTNDYSRFIQNYKSTHKTILEVSQKAYLYNDDEFGQLFDVSIDTEGNATIRFRNDSALYTKYPNGYKLPEKVFFVDKVYSGNGGYYSLVFITEKGNPIVIGGKSLIDGEEIFLKYGKNKNIINVVNYGGPGGSGYYVVDINGNVSEIQY